MRAPGQDYTGWTNELLAERCEEMGVRVNHVEAAVLVAIERGHDAVGEIVAETGLTPGQVQHAVGVLVAQGLAGQL